MRYLFLLLSSFIFSCSPNPNNLKKEEIKFNKLETFLLDFLNKNPNLLNNETTKSEGSKKFKKELFDFLTINDSTFYYNELEFNSSFGDNPYYGHFKSWSHKIKDNSIETYEMKEINVDVIMELSKSQLDTMKTKEKYRVIGKIKRYIEEDDNEFQLTSWTFDPKVDYDVIFKEKVVFDLGCIYLTPTNIKRVSQ